MNNQQSWPKGLWAALITFTFFGAVLPILYRQYGYISSYKLLAWTAILAVPVLTVMVAVLKKGEDLKNLLNTPQKMFLSFIGMSGQALSTIAFMKAMALERSLEVSLSYFVLPLFYVAVGLLFFKEKFSKLMGISLAVAIISLIFLFKTQGEVSWVLPTICFGAVLYSTMRKITNIEPTSGLFWEVLSLSPLAIIYLILSPSGFWPHNSGEWVGHIAITLANIIPMLMLVLCIRFLPFNAVGISSWFAPTLTFFLSLFLWNSPLDKAMLITFIGIWISMILYIMAIIREKT